MLITEKSKLTAAITRDLATQGSAKSTDYNQMGKAPEEKALISESTLLTTYMAYSRIDCSGHADCLDFGPVGRTVTTVVMTVTT
jgi:translation elongation factor EF-Tu-like GTPase